MKLKKLLAAALVLMLCFATACGGSSDSSAGEGEDTSLADLQEKGTMQVGMCPEYPPFETVNEEGVIEGFDVDLATELGKIMGVEVECINTPWEGLITGLENHDYDIIMSGMSPSEATGSGSEVNITDAYYTVKEVILTMDENIKSKDDLAGKKVGNHVGSTSEYAVDDLIAEGIEMESVPYNRHSEAFADLQNGNIDAMVVEDTWAKQKVTEDSGIIIVEEPVSLLEMAGVMNKGDDSFTQAFNDALKELIDNGTYDELVEKWFS